MLAHQYACQYHADDMRNPQFAHDDRSKQNNQKHHEEDERGVTDMQIRRERCHFRLQRYEKLLETTAFSACYFAPFSVFCIEWLCFLTEIVAVCRRKNG